MSSGLSQSDELTVDAIRVSFQSKNMQLSIIKSTRLNGCYL